MPELLDYTNSRTNEILETLSRLVELESFSTDKAGTDGLSAYIRDRLESIGVVVQPVPQTAVGDHLIADFGQGESQTLILCHMDTVWPPGTIMERPFRVENGLAYGPGILDMKAGIAITLHALEAIQALGLKPRQRVRVLLNSDEEVGSTTSREIIEEEARKSTHVFCLEPGAGPQGALKTGRKGVGMFQIKVTGRAAHAGNEPEKGISAVEEMAHQILKLHSLTDFSRGTTVNVGVVNGGAVRNQVAPLAEALVDLRVASMEEAQRVEREILSLEPVISGALVEVTGGLNRPPMERTESTAMLLEMVRRHAEPLGIQLTEAQVGGGSDAQFAALVGTPVLDGLGGVGEGPHAVHEYVTVAELPRRTALLVSVLVGQ
jgi:glutamate carboxypeptidase